MKEDNGIFFTNLEELQSGNGTGGRLDVAELSGEPGWFTEDFEGELSIDVYQTDDEIIVKSAIAGVDPQDLEIFVHDDLLTIRGVREEDSVEEGADYLYKECHWGGFSRSIILPVEVVPDNITAKLKNGILTVRLPKLKKSKIMNVKVEEE